jgi:hypothetical protein
MTIACCWLDDLYSKQRVTAIADSRQLVARDPPLIDCTGMGLRVQSMSKVRGRGVARTLPGRRTLRGLAESLGRCNFR